MGISNGDDELALQLVEATCMTCQSAFKLQLDLLYPHVKEESRLICLFILLFHQKRFMSLTGMHTRTLGCGSFALLSVITNGTSDHLRLKVPGDTIFTNKTRNRT